MADDTDGGPTSLATAPAPAASSNEAVNALQLNQVVGKLLDSGSVNSQAVIDALNSIASAITASLIGGTTGTTANRVLVAKGTTGRALQATPVSINPSTGAVTSAILTVDEITFAATKRALGRNTSGAGAGEEVTASQILDWVGSAAQGDILYRDSSAWAFLAPGTSGFFLKTQGASANPVWASVPSFEFFSSSQQTISPAGSQTVAHGLSGKPNLVDVVLQCTSSEHGYTSGDELALSIFGARVAVVPDATNLNCRYTSLSPVFVAPDFTTGVSTSLTDANWRMVLRAWKF